MANVNVKENNTEEKEKVENECNWLLRSPSTDDFDIISVAGMGGWSVWKGVVGVNYPITITCNECSSRADWYVLICSLSSRFVVKVNIHCNFQ